MARHACIDPAHSMDGIDEPDGDIHSSIHFEAAGRSRTSNVMERITSGQIAATCLDARRS